MASSSDEERYRAVSRDDKDPFLSDQQSPLEVAESGSESDAPRRRVTARSQAHFRRYLMNFFMFGAGSIITFFFVKGIDVAMEEPRNCVGDWSSWSTCSMTCGVGIRVRTYLVETEAAYDGKECRYTSGASAHEKCDAGICPGTEGFKAKPPLCAASVPLPVGDWASPRKFDEPEWLQYCFEPKMRPWDEFNWPGRNWCWARTKAKGCYAQKGGLPPWYWAQVWARSSDNRVPKPEEYAFPGLVNPDLCDRIDHGAPAENVSENEMKAARAWIGENLAIYVVNLKWSTERWQAMEKRLTDLGLKGERIDGIDMRPAGALEQARKDGFVPTADEFDIDKAWGIGRELVKASNPNFGQALLEDWIGTGTIGCAAAHVHAQAEAHLRAVRAGKPMVLIMEDDIWLQDDFIVKLYRLMTTETPCDWDVVALSSRCPFGTCVSTHLSRVQVDGNEPAENCHGEVQYGMFAMLYRVTQLPDINNRLKKMIWNDERPGCVPPDVAMSAISDQIAYYAVPGNQLPGYAVEAASVSNRLGMNR